MEAILSDYGEVFLCFHLNIVIQYNFQTLGFLAYDALEHHIKNEFSYSLSQCYIF